MLIDKGYYDYDFERIKAITTPITYEDTRKSESEVSSMLSRFGIGGAKSKEESMEELQQLAMEEFEQ